MFKHPRPSSPKSCSSSSSSSFYKLYTLRILQASSPNEFSDILYHASNTFPMTFAFCVPPLEEAKQLLLHTFSKAEQLVVDEETICNFLSFVQAVANFTFKLPATRPEALHNNDYKNRPKQLIQFVEENRLLDVLVLCVLPRIVEVVKERSFCASKPPPSKFRAGTSSVSYEFMLALHQLSSEAEVQSDFNNNTNIASFRSDAFFSVVSDALASATNDVDRLRYIAILAKMYHNLGATNGSTRVLTSSEARDLVQGLSRVWSSTTTKCSSLPRAEGTTPTTSDFKPARWILQITAGIFSSKENIEIFAKNNLFSQLAHQGVVAGLAESLARQLGHPHKYISCFEETNTDCHRFLDFVAIISKYIRRFSSAVVTASHELVLACDKHFGECHKRGDVLVSRLKLELAHLVTLKNYNAPEYLKNQIPFSFLKHTPINKNKNTNHDEDDDEMQTFVFQCLYSLRKENPLVCEIVTTSPVIRYALSIFGVFKTLPIDVLVLYLAKMNDQNGTYVSLNELNTFQNFIQSGSSFFEEFPCVSSSNNSNEKIEHHDLVDRETDDFAEMVRKFNVAPEVTKWKKLWIAAPYLLRIGFLCFFLLYLLYFTVMMYTRPSVTRVEVVQAVKEVTIFFSEN